MRIGKQLQFIGKDLVSDFDIDHIEHATYLIKFTDRHGNLFGHFDYDYYNKQNQFYHVLHSYYFE